MESDDSMPPLQDVSESDESGDEDFSATDATEDESDDESEYDTDEEDDVRDMIREAMETAIEADWFSGTDSAQAEAFEQEDKKGNPFLKLLGSLRG